MKMSITRALAEIKSLDARFDNALTNGVFIAVKRGKGDGATVSNSAESVQSIESLIQGSFDKVNSMIARRQALKAAVIASNASTIVKIGKEEMTVAGAIERKSSITYARQFLDHMTHQYNTASNSVIQLSSQLEGDLDKMVVALFGNDKSKFSADQAASATKPRRDQFEPTLLDPLKLSEKISSLRETISTFLLEVDFCLSESNAKTEIEIQD